MPAVVTTLKMGRASAVLSRSYNTVPGPQAMRTSAIQITRELLRTKGVTGLYRGLGATLMRWDVQMYCHITCLINQFYIFLSINPNMFVCILSFQGHPVLCCVLSSFCTCAPAWPAFIWRPIRPFLLVLFVWLLGWIHRRCGCQSLWWWETHLVHYEVKWHFKEEHHFIICIIYNFLSHTVVKTRLQSLRKGTNEETYSGVVDCIRWT